MNLRRLLKTVRHRLLGYPWKKTMNAQLCTAMHASALKDNAESRLRLYEEFLRSELFLPVIEYPKLDSPTTNLQMSLPTDREGKVFCPAFTDVEALKNWDPNTPFVQIKAPALFQVVAGMPVQRIVINPYDPIRKMLRPGGTLFPVEYKVLAQGLIPSPSSGGMVRMDPPTGQQTMLLRPTSQVHPEVAGRIRRLVHGKQAVLQVFWLGYRTGNSTPGHTLGFTFARFTNADEAEAILAEIARDLTREPVPNFTLDMIMLNAKLHAQATSVGHLLYSSGQLRH